MLGVGAVSGDAVGGGCHGAVLAWR
jgi:hypothetical protein